MTAAVTVASCDWSPQQSHDVHIM